MPGVPKIRSHLGDVSPKLMRRALRLHSSDLSRRIGAALAKEAEGLELRVYGFRVYDLGVVNLGPTVGYVLSRRMEGSERGRERERERKKDRDRQTETERQKILFSLK